MGLIVMVSGIIYFVVAGRHLLPDRQTHSKGAITKILDVQDRIGIRIDPHIRLSELDLKSSEASMIEVVISQPADFTGKTLKEVDFWAKYGLTVLAIWHKEEVIISRLSDVPLQLGDILLVHGRVKGLITLKGIWLLSFWNLLRWNIDGQTKHCFRCSYLEG